MMVLGIHLHAGLHRFVREPLCNELEQVLREVLVVFGVETWVTALHHTLRLDM
jgi:hypothetical protein